MKKFTQILVGAILFALVLMRSISLDAQNLVQNASFEDGVTNGIPTGWTTRGDESEVVYSVVEDGHESDNAFQVDVLGTGWSIMYISQDVAVIEPGATYTVSFWYKVVRDPSSSDGGITNEIGPILAPYSLKDNIEENYYDPMPYALDMWIPYVKDGVVVPDHTTSFIIELGFSQQVKVLLDDFSVVKTADYSGIPVTGVSLDKNTMSLSLPANNEGIITATVAPENATNQEVMWLSSNSAVFVSDDGNGNGIVTATQPGTTTITAVSKNGSKKSGCIVTVTDDTPFDPNLLKNGDFEGGLSWMGGPDRWNTYGDAVYSLVSDVDNSSPNVLQVDVSSNELVRTNEIYQSVYNMTPGVVYDFSFRYKVLRAPSNPDGGIFVELGYGEMDNTGPLTYTLDTWMTYSKEEMIYPSDLFSFSAVLYFNGGIKVLIDDVMLTEHGWVTPTDVTGVSLNKTALTLEINQEETLSATVAPADATNQEVTWAIDNLDIADVDYSTGKITAKASGTAIIYAVSVDKGIQATCALTVTGEAVPVTGVSLDRSAMTLQVGGSAETLIATIEPANATNKGVTWSSNRPSVVYVSDMGEVAHRGTVGTATITVTTVDGEYTADCEVTVTRGDVGVYNTGIDSGFALENNPVTDMARFTFDAAGENALITITDMGGKVVARRAVGTGETKATINVVRLPKGIYIANYSDNDNKRASVKLVK